MYVKLFPTLWTGTLVAKPDVQLVFIFLLAHKDSDGVVECTPEHVAALTGLAVERVQAALAVLEAPDPRSRSKEYEGRRLLRLDPDRDWGWTVTTHEHYRGLRNEEERRESNRLRMRTARAFASDRHVAPMFVCSDCRDVCASVHPSAPPCTAVRHGAPRCTHTDTDTDTDTPTPTATTEHGSAAAPQSGLGKPQSPAGARTTPKADTDATRQASEAVAGALASGEAFLTVGGKRWVPKEAKLQAWAEAYPDVLLVPQFRKMRAWLAANPHRCRTTRGCDKFVQAWLARGSEVPAFAVRSSGVRSAADAEYAAANGIGQGGKL